MNPVKSADTKPDCLSEISQLAQVREGNFDSIENKVASQHSRAVKYAVANRISLKITKPNLYSLEVPRFSDSAFANNYDLSLQPGYLCFLDEDTGAAAPLSFKLFKAKRAARSAFSGTVTAFSDLFDAANTLAEEPVTVTTKRVSVQLLTDSRSMFYVVYSRSTPSENRLMLDIAAAH